MAIPAAVSAIGGGVKTVVIDAGHGGNDPGNLGTRRYKTQEKDIALAVALKVGAYIEENLPDVKVIYTRKTDKLVDLRERAEIANRANADLFISIHCDAFNESSVHGATSFVMGRNHDDDNLRVAMQENSVILLEENYEEKYEGFDPNKPESYIAFTLYQSAFINQSISFAQKVQDQFRDRVSRRDRGVKQQPLMVTKIAVMPAVLIELGFLTNPSEEDFLNSEKGQSYMASAIFRAFRDYKAEREGIEKQQKISPVERPTELEPALTPGEINKDIEENKKKSAVASEQQVESENSNIESRVFFSVQIATSTQKRDTSPAYFNGVENVEFYQHSGLFKYIVGRTTNLEEAKAILARMKQSGFNDAFIIAMADGQRITIAKARSLLE
jgi:N-acetylmuramoyl-L-alanine amidase